ncbi:E3 ubiquitin-protein ligase XIAP-like [Ruditapes philippinarum]|uniref:E3 ubiquitin-protein ligase XIAP-like n=1 Tax=Ruditapes philippinarum TaxID=129788 RepID=UPI00295B4267|nr:E3 ubiquitin-protein ligase XIAP-like [Ruditapes philippinarum]
MEKKFANYATGKPMKKRDENSEKNLTQFSDSDGNHMYMQQHTATDVEAEIGRQQSAVCASAKPKRQTKSLIPSSVLGTNDTYLRQSPSPLNTSNYRNIKNASNTSGSGEHTHDRQGRKQEKGNPPYYLNYKTYEARLSSFKHWPKQIRQTKEEMAEAGLFYTGLHDLVRCFHCGGKMCKWDANDDVWGEHARFYPLCMHVKTQKGDNFIAWIQSTANAEYATHEKDQNRVGHLEETREELLKMGFSDANFNYARRHLNSLGIDNPDLREVIRVLCD